MPHGILRSCSCSSSIKHALRLLVISTFAISIPSASAADLTALAKDVPTGIGQAQSYPGTVGGIIVIFEEEHDSFTMNLEESVGLVKLFTKYGMKDIGLEGFTEADKPWTKDFSPNPASALAVLKKGEINSAAFMALGYGVNVHPIEKSSEYIVNDEDISRPVSQYILKIALNGVNQKIKNNTLQADVAQQISMLRAIKDSAGLQRLIISQDSFAKDALDRMERFDILERQDSGAPIALLESIVGKASALNLDIDPASAAVLNNQIIFLKARRAASKTMASRVAELATSQSSVVGMIIGAAHTRDVVSILTGQNRPVVVISPNRAPPGGSPAKYNQSQLEDLYKQEPIEHDKITVGLRGLEKVKPKTPFNARWLQSKSQIFEKTDGLLAAVFGASPPGGDGGGGRPPKPPIDWSTLPADSPEFRQLLLALSDEKFRGKYISIDRARIELFRQGTAISIVFPIQIRSTDGEVLKEIWGRAWPTTNVHAPSADEVLSDVTGAINLGNAPSSARTEIDITEISKAGSLVLGDFERGGCTSQTAEIRMTCFDAGSPCPDNGSVDN